jgi:hypothetical protein
MCDESQFDEKISWTKLLWLRNRLQIRKHTNFQNYTVDD